MHTKTSKRKELKNKEHLLKEQEKNITNQAQQLDEMKNVLLKRQKELEEWHSLLEQKENEISNRELTLKKLENESWAHQYWQSCEELKKIYQNLDLHMKELQPTIREFGTKRQYNFLHTPSQSLALLHREVTTINNFKDTDIPDRICEILIALGADKIEPQYNDVYDSKIHEKVDANYTGTKIDYCLASGWSLKDCILVRALVITHV